MQKRISAPVCDAIFVASLGFSIPIEERGEAHILDTDASENAIGRMLSQVGADGREQVLAKYYPDEKGTTSPQEKNC